MRKTIFLLSLVGASLCLFTGCDTIDDMKYAKALNQLQNQEYDKAKDSFAALEDYKNSVDYHAECIYQLGKKEVQAENYEGAIAYFEQISEYETAATMIKECNYLLGKQHVENGKYDEAEACFEGLGEYKDVSDLLNEVEYQLAVVKFDNKEYIAALEQFLKIQTYKDVPDMLDKCKYRAAIEYFDAGDYVNAYKIFVELGDYKKSVKYVEDTLSKGKKAIYKQAKTLYGENKMEEARNLFEAVNDYKKSVEFIQKIDVFQAVQNSVWVCQDKYMKKIGSRYTMVFDGWNLTVTITQSDATGNKDSDYQYVTTLEKYNGKWCLKYGKDTYCMYDEEKDIVQTYRGKKKQDKYKRDETNKTES